MNKTERKMRARRAVYEFLTAWSTLIQDPEEDVPQRIIKDGAYHSNGLTPEDISEAAKFVSKQMYRKHRHYVSKINNRANTE